MLKEKTNINKLPAIKKFAFLGNTKTFTKKLKYLAHIAEPENWKYHNPKAGSDTDESIAVLYQYIINTFAKVEDEDKILMNENHAILNTGLMTSNGEEIFMLFAKSNGNGPAPWVFLSFFKESAHEIPQVFRDKLPKHVDYFENCPEEAYFDPSLIILGNFDHIIEDNFERLPEALRTMPSDAIVTFLNASKDVMQKRILRNNRLAVPQYYKKKIMYLVPLRFGEEVIPLAIEKHENTYRINTILTTGMAYCNARLVMKPESNWLKLD